MVEFPLLVRWSARDLQRLQTEIYLRWPEFPDINFVSSNRPPDLVDMWETSTLAASFHARLNVARQARFRPWRGGCVNVAALKFYKFRSTEAGFWFSARS